MARTFVAAISLLLVLPLAAAARDPASDAAVVAGVVPHRGSTGIGQPEAGVAVEPNLGVGSDRPRRQGPWMTLPP
jgi:hypothetical protein